MVNVLAFLNYFTIVSVLLFFFWGGGTHPKKLKTNSLALALCSGITPISALGDPIYRADTLSTHWTISLESALECLNGVIILFNF